MSWGWEHRNYSENHWHLTPVWWTKVIGSYRKKKIPPKSSLKEELTYCLSTKPNGSEWGDGDMFCMVNIHLTITVFLSHSHVAGQCNSTGQWRWRVHHQRHSKSPAIHQWELLNVDRPMRRNTRIILYALYSAIRIMFSAGTPCR